MDNWRPGVLNKEQVNELCNNDFISNADPSKIDASSIDLHINDPIYELKGCVKPKSDQDINVLCSGFLNQHKNFNSDGTISLEKGKTYIFSVKEYINFKDTPFCGQATGKSTFGRLDILTRLLTNHSDYYDFVTQNYRGSLWVEVTPITFPIKIKKNMSLNQLRLYKGEPQACCIQKDDLGLWGALILDEDGNKVKDGNRLNCLTLNLEEDPNLKNKICAFAVKKDKIFSGSEELDLTIDIKKERLSADKYWDRLTPTQDNPLSIEIDPERFYILRSRERFRLPESVAIYCQAVTENLGELRIHYAGFAHPCFGTERKDKKGAPLIFEVRGHNIKAFLQHGETLARLDYYYMSKDAIACEPSYDDQELTLSKYFQF
jgi:dCTP deaminase